MQKFILATAAVSADAFLLRRQQGEEKAKTCIKPCAPEPKQDVCVAEIKSLLKSMGNATDATVECVGKDFSTEDHKPLEVDCTASGCVGCEKKEVPTEVNGTMKNMTVDMICTLPSELPVGCGTVDTENSIFHNATQELKIECTNLKPALLTAMTSASKECPHPTNREKEASSSGSGF